MWKAVRIGPSGTYTASSTLPCIEASPFCDATPTHL